MIDPRMRFPVILFEYVKGGKQMKKIFSLVAGLVLLSGGSSFAAFFDFSSIPQSSISFYGAPNTFVFEPEIPGLYDFVLTSGGTDPSTAGLMGSITGAFTIGAISTPFPGLQTAPVTGSGKLSVTDASGYQLTTNLQWYDISTYYGFGGINTLGNANLTDITYGGTNTDLLDLFTAGLGSTVVSFQFMPGKSLSELTAGTGKYSTSYSGSVPEPGTIMLFGTGLLGLAALSLRKRKE